MSAHPVVTWKEKGELRSARWRSESGAAPPHRVVVADDHMRADAAYRLACEGTALLWRGDFQNARQLLQAMARRADQSLSKRAERKPIAAGETAAAASPADVFNRYRMGQAQRARILGMLLLQFGGGHALSLPRAPDVGSACSEAYGVADEPYVASLRELLGLIGAHEWRRNGVPVPALGDRIHPHYGVFSPVRREYVDLVAEAPLPAALAAQNVASQNLASQNFAIDVGTGTGVLAAILARRGVARVVATDSDARALACARDNIERLALRDRVEVVQADLFPDIAQTGPATLVVCNPPWIPARPTSPLEHAIYDPDSHMLRAFLAGLAAHLAPEGEGWLILSDFA
jgi:hypothetical protein